MNVVTEIKLQAKILEWEAPNGFWLTEPNIREALWVIAGVKIDESRVRT